MFTDGLCGAVRSDGTIAVPPRYDWVGPFADGRAPVRVGGLYGFVDEDGHEIVKPQYLVVGDYKFGFAQVEVDGRSGLIDRDGKMVIPPKYGFVEAIAPDRFRIGDQHLLGGSPGGEDFSRFKTWFVPLGVSFRPTSDITNGTFEIIDVSGRIIQTADPATSLPFDASDPSLRIVHKRPFWGIVRKDGSWLVEPKFDYVESLKDGLARVTIRGKVGFIDRTGSFVIDPTLNRAGSFVTGVGRTDAERDGVVGLIDKTGTFVVKTDYEQIHLAVEFNKNFERAFGWHFKTVDGWGLLDLDGNTLIAAQFDQSISPCVDGRLVALKDRHWLLFREDGTPLLPPGGRLVTTPCGGISPYVLAIGDKYELVDTDLRPITPTMFDEIKPATHDTRDVRIGDKWGRIASDGRWVIPAKYDYLSGYSHLVVAAINGKRGFLRIDGSWLIEPKFDAARLKDSDTAYVTLAGATGLLRLADQSWLIPPRDGVMCGIPGAVMSQNNGRRAILSPTGETWIDIGAERVGTDIEIGLVTFLKDRKWGLVDTAGHVVVEPTYDEPVYFASNFRGVAWAKQSNRWCAIDRHGHQVQHIACRDKDPFPTNRFECKVEP